MRLPVNVLFHPEAEPPLSLASRLARAMAFPSVADFLGESTVRAVVRGDEDALMMLSAWSGVPTDQLRRFAVPTSKAAGEWRLGDAVFRKEMRVAGRFRSCPRCLVDDVERGIGRPGARPYERASWLTRAVTACTRHGELLVEAGEDAPASDVALFVAEGWHRRCRTGFQVGESVVEVDSYIESRIAGNRGRSFIDSQEVHVVLVLCNFLGWLIHNRLPSFGVRETGIREAGFYVAREGREAVERLLTAAIERHRPIAHNVIGFFGPSVRYLQRNAYVQAYAETVTLLQEIVERLIPVGAGDRFLRPVERRHFHSIQSASTDYGFTCKRTRRLLEEHAIIGRSDDPDHQIWFLAESAESVLRQARKNMTTDEAATALGTNSARVRELIERGLLNTVERTIEGGRSSYRIAERELNRFRRRLFERVPLVTGRTRLVNLNAVSQQQTIAQVDVIEMILKGDLVKVARGDDNLNFGSLLVDVHELPTPLQVGETAYDQSTYLSLTKVERALSTTTATVVELVKNGLLPTELGTNPRTRRQQPFVHRGAVDTFLETHMSLHQIARRWHRNIAGMRSELEKHGLKPVLETSGKIARYYRKVDLADAEMLPPDV